MYKASGLGLMFYTFWVIFHVLCKEDVTVGKVEDGYMLIRRLNNVFIYSAQQEDKKLDHKEIARLAQGYGGSIEELVNMFIYFVEQQEKTINMNSAKIKQLNNRIRILERETGTLKNKNEPCARCISLEKKIGVLEGTIAELKEKYSLNGNQVQTAKVKNGMTIAMKSGTDLEDVKRLLDAGKSDFEIMNELGISRSTLWRRKKQMGANGTDNKK